MCKLGMLCTKVSCSHLKVNTLFNEIHYQIKKERDKEKKATEKGVVLTRQCCHHSKGEWSAVLYYLL